MFLYMYKRLKEKNCRIKYKSFSKPFYATTSFENNEVSLSEQKSNLTEVDLVSAISNLISQQYALQASMQAASSIKIPTLLNYM